MILRDLSKQIADKRLAIAEKQLQANEYAYLLKNLIAPIGTSKSLHGVRQELTRLKGELAALQELRRGEEWVAWLSRHSLCPSLSPEPELAQDWGAGPHGDVIC